MRLHPKTVVSEILANLSENDTASSLARKINYNPKTIAKYLEMLEYLGILKRNEVKTGSRKISIYNVRTEGLSRLSSLTQTSKPLDASNGRRIPVESRSDSERDRPKKERMKE